MAATKTRQRLASSLKSPNRIGLGSRVTITDGNREETYTLVRPEEANVAQGRISVEAPVGKALCAHRTGQGVIVQAPSGILRYVVLRVE